MVEFTRVVRARTREEIENAAWVARGNLGISPFDRVSVARLIEHALPEMIKDFEYRIADDGTLGSAEAVTDGFLPIITFSRRTYDGLYRDQPRPRMTTIHELGHLLMHTGQRWGYGFLRAYDPLVDPERQADIFAEAFLMPECAFRRIVSIDDAMKRFGVSRDAACFRARTLGMHRQLELKDERRFKKKGSSKRRTP